MIVLILMLVVALFLPIALLVAPLLSWRASTPSTPLPNGAEAKNVPQALNRKVEPPASGTVATLLTAAASQYWYVRQGAARQLGQLGLASWCAVPFLKQMKVLDPEARVRLTAAEALEQIRAAQEG